MTGDDRWIIIPNWDKFQHYKDRGPAWIKVYLELRSDDEWRRLTLAQRGLLVCLWIEYGASRGVLRASDIPARVAQKNLRRSLDSLLAAGFIEVSASRPLALARSREERREPAKAGSLSKRETAEEKEPSPPQQAATPAPRKTEYEQRLEAEAPPLPTTEIERARIFVRHTGWRDPDLGWDLLERFPGLDDDDRREMLDLADTLRAEHEPA